MKLLNIELVHHCLYDRFLCSSYDPQSLLVFFALLCGFAITKAAYIRVGIKLNIGIKLNVLTSVTECLVAAVKFYYGFSVHFVTHS